MIVISKLKDGLPAFRLTMEESPLSINPSNVSLFAAADIYLQI